MSWDDTVLLVITSSITSKFQHLSSQVFQDTSQVDRSTGTNSGSILALLQEATDTTNRELQASLETSADTLLSILTTTTLSLSSTSYDQDMISNCLAGNPEENLNFQIEILNKNLPRETLDCGRSLPSSLFLNFKVVARCRDIFLTIGCFRLIEFGFDLANR